MSRIVIIATLCLFFFSLQCDSEGEDDKVSNHITKTI